MRAHKRAIGLTLALVAGHVLATSNAWSMPLLGQTESGALIVLAAEKPESIASKKADETSSPEHAKKNTPKQLTLIEKRRRAAEQQRLLLQQKSLSQQDQMRDAQLRHLRQQQDNTLREQQDLQRRLMVQQNQAIRRMQNPPPIGQARVPRLTPLDRPLIEQRNPSCGVPGMPLC